MSNKANKQNKANKNTGNQEGARTRVRRVEGSMKKLHVSNKNTRRLAATVAIATIINAVVTSGVLLFDDNVTNQASATSAQQDAEVQNDLPLVIDTSGLRDQDKEVVENNLDAIEQRQKQIKVNKQEIEALRSNIENILENGSS